MAGAEQGLMRGCWVMGRGRPQRKRDLKHELHTEEDIGFGWESQPLSKLLNISEAGASLVVQWLRIRLPMQGTQVRALVWEDPTCRGATRPVSHSY